MIMPHEDHLKLIPELNCPVTSLKGIAKKRAELLAMKGLHTLLDLLFFLPIRYEDRRRILSINNTGGGETVWVKGKVVSGGDERFFRTGKRLFRIVIRDDTGDLELVWFHYKKAHLSRFTHKGLGLMAYGSIRKKMGRRQLIHPDISLADPDREEELLSLHPVYSAVKGMSGNVLRSAIKQALDRCQDVLRGMAPEEIPERLGLPDMFEAIRSLHIPPRESSVDLFNRFRTRYHQRLTFDRFFHVMLNIAIRKNARKMRTGHAFLIPDDMEKRFQKHFPFVLTGHQSKVVGEIINDIGSGRPMNRLLQGDVGCGKTVVAAAASYVTILNHRQVAVMVPTQILARQHFIYFSDLPGEMGFKPVLLTGAQKGSRRIQIHERIRNGEFNVIIGTQSLIQESLSFSRLGLVVIDEQHRFGVRQRALLDKKGVNPHLLVMTATPIPRTLAMTMYADMDISVIKEYPEGRQVVKTYLVEEDKKAWVYDRLKRRISAGQQALVICPVIEGSEESDLKNALETYKELKQLFPHPLRVGLVHGRLSAQEKDTIMEEFCKGRMDLLVGTTVIEVGIHAPGATVMIILQPERFGLIQLHQLRGRVGRGSERGICLLMSGKTIPERSLSRLKVLVDTNDGFEIARKDLEMRGQGELMGTRQAGAGELDFSEVFREPELLGLAKIEAEKIVRSDPGLLQPENRRLRQMLEFGLGRPLDL